MAARANIVSFLPGSAPGEVMRVSILQADGTEVVAGYTLRGAIDALAKLASHVQGALVAAERAEALRRSGRP